MLMIEVTGASIGTNFAQIALSGITTSAEHVAGFAFPTVPIPAEDLTVTMSSPNPSELTSLRMW